MRDKFTFTIYFEFFGKKMKTTVEATSQAEALEIVRGRIHIIKVEPMIENPFDNIFQRFNH